MDDVVKGFLDQGLLGLIIIAQGFVIVRLWTRYDAIQEKRIDEARTSITSIEQNTSSLDTLTKVLEGRGK